MLDSALVVALLIVMAVAVIVTMALVGVMAYDLRRALRRAEAVLPHCDQALREARTTMHQARQILTRANQASRTVEGVIGRVCQVASGALEELGAWKGKVQELLTGHVGNGAGSRGSRRSYRRR